MKPNVPKDIRLKIETALLCLNEGSHALDAYDMDYLAESLADTCDLLVSIIGDYDIHLTDKHTEAVNKARKEIES